VSKPTKVFYSLIALTALAASLWVLFVPRWSAARLNRLQSFTVAEVSRIDIITYQGFWHETSRKSLTEREDVAGFLNVLKAATKPKQLEHPITYRTRYVQLTTSSGLMRFVVRDTRDTGILIDSFRTVITEFISERFVRMISAIMYGSNWFR
jgi:hypothetical protein